MNIEEKFELITRNLQEVLVPEELKELLKKKKEVSIYWGTMPTGSISIAYFFPMLKIADFLKAGCNVKILIADLHAALDSVPWEILDKRTAYYTEAVKSVLKAIGVDIKKLEFVRGSSYQTSDGYVRDLLKLCTITSVGDSTRAATEAVKSARGENVKLSGLIYPLMQSLDEVYLEADVQFAGLDQRKIMVFARENLHRIGYAPRIELMTPMIRGLTGGQMSSSVESSKIDLSDDEKTVEKKVKGALFVEGDPENGVMDLLKYFILVIKQDKKEKLIISRPEKFGGDKHYSSYEDLEKDVKGKKIHPLDVKNAAAKELSLMLKKVQTEKFMKLHKEAYS